MSKTKQCNLIVPGLTIDHDNTLKLCGPIPQRGQKGGDCSIFKEGGNCSKADGTQCGEECGTFEGCQKFSSDCCFQENRAVWDAPSGSWKSAWCYNSYRDSENKKTCGRPTWRKN